MKKYLLLPFMLLSITVKAQLSGTKTIPGDYATITAAITALNANGVGAGGVTFNIAAGYTETGNTTITATGTAANPIIFQKNGAGANPTITAGVGTGWDAIFKMVGTDYITFDGLTLQENPANSSGNYIQKTENGFGFFKVDATNGCQYNTIKNCTISLDRLFYQISPGNIAYYSTAVYMNNENAGNAWINSESTATGTHSYNIIQNNTISDVGQGVFIYGYHNTSSSIAVIERHNEVKDNTITYGGNSVARGIGLFYAANCTVSGNTISTHTAHQAGAVAIDYNPTGKSGCLITNNTIQLDGNSVTGAQKAIQITGGGGPMAADPLWKSITITNNTILPSNTNYDYTGIYCLYGGAEFEIIENNIINLSSNPSTNSGEAHGIDVGNWWADATIITIKNNLIQGHASSLTNFFGIYTSDNTDLVTIENNKVINNSSSIYQGINITGSNGSVAKNNLIASGTSNTHYTYIGLQISSDGTSAINNYIGNRASYSASAVAFGLQVGANGNTNPIKVYHNTVYIDGNPSSVNVTSAYSINSTQNVDTRNNIFYNAMLPGTFGNNKISAFANGLILANTNFNCKNNLFYAGVPSATNSIYSSPQGNFTTLENYKMHVCSKDINSVSETVPFLSLDYTNSNYLHINPAMPSLVNNMGFSTPEITLDYDGDTRSATTPDIGADELNGITGILTTPLTPPVLWLKADAGVYTDAGVTTATNGQTVQQWNDQSCNGFNASQPDGSKRPAWQQNAFNGKPALWFDGTNGNYWLENTVNTPVATTGSARTYFVVAKAACSATGTYYPGGHLFTNRRTACASTLEFVQNGSGIFHGGNLCSNHPEATSVNFTSGQNQPFVGSWRTNGTGSNLDFWFNGIAATTANANFIDDNGSAGYCIGDRRDAFQFDVPTGRYDWQGHIAEIIVYDRALTDGERQSVETYLYNKYQLGTPALPSACNVKLWLKADTGVFTDAGVTAATNGQDIQQWNDQSANGYNVTQTVAASKPIWEQYAFNGKPALFFDGSTGDKNLNNITQNLVGSGSARTIFIVAQKKCEWSDGGTLFSFRKTPLMGALMWYSTGGNLYTYTDGQTTTNNATVDNSLLNIAYINPTFFTYLVPTQNAKIDLYLNGTQQSVSQVGNIASENGTNGFTVGAREDFGSQGWKGWIAEVIVYDRALTTSERQSVESYLQTKYGTTSLPPVFNNIPSATVISNATQADGTWNHIYNSTDNSKVIASVKDNCLALGTINSTVYIDGTAGQYNGQRYMRRHYVINPATDPVGTKRVRLYYTNADFADLQTYVPTLTSASQLVITKYDGANEDGVFDPTGGTVELLPSSQITTGTVFGVNYLEFDVTGFSEFWIHTGFTALPLQFISFSAQKCSNNNVCLNWKTANEQNVSHFDIERSTDGFVFSKIGTKQASNQQQNNYTYTDDISIVQTKQVYYRIKQVDVNTSSKLSNVQQINLDSKTAIVIYPNPVKDEIKITGWQKVKAAQLMDASGRVIMQWNINSSILPINKIVKGIYMLQLQLKTGETQNQKILKE